MADFYRLGLNQCPSVARLPSGRKCLGGRAPFGNRLRNRLPAASILGIWLYLPSQRSADAWPGRATIARPAMHVTYADFDRPTHAEATIADPFMLARTSAKPAKGDEETFSIRNFQMKSADATTGAGDRSDLRVCSALRDDTGCFLRRRRDSEERRSPAALADSLQSTAL